MKKQTITALLALVWVTGQAKEKTIVWEQPSTEVNTMIEGYFSTLLEITRVEFAMEETRVFMHVANQPDNWVKFAASTHLVANGKTYALKHLEGMELDKEVHLTNHGYADIVFHFEPLPMKTQSFDFIGGDSDGTFKLLGVEDTKTRADQLFPSNWRNVQTGDWDKPDSDIDERTTVTTTEKTTETDKKTTEKTTENPKRTTEKTTERIIRLMKENPQITNKELAVACGITEDGVYWNTKKLRKNNIIRRVGGDKGGHWEVLE